MKRISRRKFLGSSAALPLGFGLAGEASAQDTGTAATGNASMIVTSGNVYTMASDNPKAEAIAVRGNRLLAVGSNEDIIALANAGTRRLDVTGMTVTPAHSSTIRTQRVTTRSRPGGDRSRTL